MTKQMVFDGHRQIRPEADFVLATPIDHGVDVAVLFDERLPRGLGGGEGFELDLDHLLRKKQNTHEQLANQERSGDRAQDERLPANRVTSRSRSGGDPGDS